MRTVVPKNHSGLVSSTTLGSAAPRSRSLIVPPRHRLLWPRYRLKGGAAGEPGCGRTVDVANYRCLCHSRCGRRALICVEALWKPPWSRCDPSRPMPTSSTRSWRWRPPWPWLRSLRKPTILFRLQALVLFQNDSKGSRWYGQNLPLTIASLTNLCCGSVIV